MTTLEIKSDLINKINTLSKSKLSMLHGLVLNIEANNLALEDWDALSDELKLSIDESISQIKNGNFHTHANVMSDLRNRIKNA
jgi:hypothetical protein